MVCDPSIGIVDAIAGHVSRGQWVGSAPIEVFYFHGPLLFSPRFSRYSASSKSSCPSARGEAACPAMPVMTDLHPVLRQPLNRRIIYLSRPQQRHFSTPSHLAAPRSPPCRAPARSQQRCPAPPASRCVVTSSSRSPLRASGTATTACTAPARPRSPTPPPRPATPFRRRSWRTASPAP